MSTGEKRKKLMQFTSIHPGVLVTNGEYLYLLTHSSFGVLIFTSGPVDLV